MMPLVKMPRTQGATSRTYASASGASQSLRSVNASSACPCTLGVIGIICSTSGLSMTAPAFFPLAPDHPRPARRVNCEPHPRARGERLDGTRSRTCALLEQELEASERLQRRLVRRRRLLIPLAEAGQIVQLARKLELATHDLQQHRLALDD